jgi:orotate phosphoribosyltransferase
LLKVELQYGKPDVIARCIQAQLLIVLVAQELGVPFVYVRPEPKSHGRKTKLKAI